MKKQLSPSILLLMLILSFSTSLNTQIPRTLSYQGVFVDSLGNPLSDGEHVFGFSLFDDSISGNQLWSESHTIQLKRGLISAVLGSINPFPDSVRFHKPYWLAIACDRCDYMEPRIPLTAVGYSINSVRADTANYAISTPQQLFVDSSRIAATVPENSITGSKISNSQIVRSINNKRDNVILAAQGGATITSSNDTIIINAGSGGGGTGIQGIQNTNNTLDIIDPSGPTVTVNVKSGIFLPLTGGIMTGAITSTGNPSITMGKGNFGAGNTNSGTNAFVAGRNNQALATYATVGGGQMNIVDSISSVISGGEFNHASNILTAIGGGSGNDASGQIATIAGGSANNASGNFSTIGGGSSNSANGDGSAISGGGVNVTTSSYSTVGGGNQNQATGGWSIVGGGKLNRARGQFSVVSGGGGSSETDSNSASGSYSTISGGSGNKTNSNYSVIGGGNYNEVTNSYGTISGGYENTATGEYSAISGGRYNSVNSNYSAIGGGNQNSASGNYSIVAGGSYNRARGAFSVVAGGGLGSPADSNSALADWSVISGGFHNTSVGSVSVIGGGDHNTAYGPSSVIGGGKYNSANGTMSVISGGMYNISRGSFSVVGGGGGATIADSNSAVGDYSTVAGGSNNIARQRATTVGGGRLNRAEGLESTVSGGLNNSTSDSYATVGGGVVNRATGWSSTVPGGNNNHASGSVSFAAGYNANAIHDGSFVWGDFTEIDITSDTTNQFKIRASNGVNLASTAGSTKEIRKGDYYSDNAIVAWGKVSSGGSISTYEFGTASVVRNSTGNYTITLDTDAAIANTLIPLAIAETDTPPNNAATARIVSINQVSASTFEVYILNGAYAPTDNDFTFIVTGR